jgi:hypothetical protein
MNLLTALQAQPSEKCPYVFMDAERWAYYRDSVDTGQWRNRDLVNNTPRRFKTLCRRAGVREFTIHDLRRSCITNWARKLPIHVVQQLAGHADINTTRKYYLSVQDEDIRRAKKVQKALLGELPPVTTDPKLTPRGPKARFPEAQAVQAATGSRAVVEGWGSVPDRARTYNLRLRRPTLCPIELRERVFSVAGRWYRAAAMVSTVRGSSGGTRAWSGGARRPQVAVGRGDVER